MIGIHDIGVYIASRKLSNFERKSDFDVDEEFLEKKLGITHVAVKADEEKTSDMAVRAFEALNRKCHVDKSQIQCLIVVTQNPDYSLPHTSAIVHAKLDLMPSCACFDVSLGCSGFVYGLSIIESFMEKNGFNCGVLITADPYSGIVDRNDKNTSLLFGDAATATLINAQPRFVSGNFVFGTMGKSHQDLICRNNKLYMNGRSIFDFTARLIPTVISEVAQKNNTTITDIDKFIFHQASSFIHQTIVNRLKIDPQKAPFTAREYGNTVSSSIPILLEQDVGKSTIRSVALCGFGVGLSWAASVLFRAA